MNAEIPAERDTLLANIYPHILTKRIYARLDFTIVTIGNAIKMETYYFGSEIQLRVWKNRNNDFRCSINILNDNGLLEMDKILNHKTAYNLISKIVSLINDYVKTRPFVIVRYSYGQYRLLDPNGMDYIGQYVTLKDAKETSLHNFLL